MVNKHYTFCSKGLLSARLSGTQCRRVQQSASVQPWFNIKLPLSHWQCYQLHSVAMPLHAACHSKCSGSLTLIIEAGRLPAHCGLHSKTLERMCVNSYQAGHTPCAAEQTENASVIAAEGTTLFSTMKSPWSVKGGFSSVSVQTCCG